MFVNNAAETVWVFVELYSPTGIRSFRGRLAVADFEAILGGTYRRPFFALMDTHWFETEENPETKQRVRHTVAAGRDGIWQRLVGTFHLPAAQIITLAPMTDCSDVFLPTAAPENASSRWERESQTQKPVEEPVAVEPAVAVEPVPVVEATSAASDDATNPPSEEPPAPPRPARRTVRKKP